MPFSIKEENNKSFKSLASIQSDKKGFHLLISEILSDKQFNLIDIQGNYSSIYIYYICFI